MVPIDDSTLEDVTCVVCLAKGVCGDWKLQNLLSKYREQLGTEGHSHCASTKY